MVGSGLNVTRPAHEVRYWVALLLRRLPDLRVQGLGLEQHECPRPLGGPAAGRPGLRQPVALECAGAGECRPNGRGCLQLVEQNP